MSVTATACRAARRREDGRASRIKVAGRRAAAQAGLDPGAADPRRAFRRGQARAARGAACTPSARKRPARTSASASVTARRPSWCSATCARGAARSAMSRTAGRCRPIRSSRSIWPTRSPGSSCATSSITSVDRDDLRDGGAAPFRRLHPCHPRSVTAHADRGADTRLPRSLKRSRSTCSPATRPT